MVHFYWIIVLFFLWTVSLWSSTCVSLNDKRGQQCVRSFVLFCDTCDQGSVHREGKCNALESFSLLLSMIMKSPFRICYSWYMGVWCFFCIVWWKHGGFLCYCSSVVGLANASGINNYFIWEVRAKKTSTATLNLKMLCSSKSVSLDVPMVLCVLPQSEQSDSCFISLERPHHLGLKPAFINFMQTGLHLAQSFIYWSN